MKNGRPTSDPQIAIFKTARIGGKDVRISFGDAAHPASLTDLAVKTTVARFRETFGHEPDTMPGSLADDNKAIFQRAYATEILKGADADTAAQRAIMQTPFARKRYDNGYKNIKAETDGPQIEILIGNPPTLVKVPNDIKVKASK